MLGAERQKNCHWLFASCCSKTTASPCPHSLLSLLVLCGVYNTGHDISCKCHRSVIVNSLLHRRLLWNKTQEERTIQNLRNDTGELVAIKVGELKRIVGMHRRWERNSSLPFTRCLQSHFSVMLEIKVRDSVSLEGMWWPHWRPNKGGLRTQSIKVPWFSFLYLGFCLLQS